ncbi:NAD(P)/FAD-dependent oxidoreductase [candidate division KSB1 bacterium]|nr:NAD(P)/FAD-dependent oxidoreductase [candidate division KSB1 bacterium]
MTLKKDVIIVGAGPAGLITAIQLNRFDISCLIVEKNSIGGLLKNANQVENYLGFPEGISGNALIELFKKHISKNDIQIIFEGAVNLDFQEGKFLITTKNYCLESEIAVIATGTKAKEIKNLTENQKAQNRIFYEVYKIQNAESKKIAIIGAGDAAFDYALNLSRQNNVTIFNCKDQEKCLPVLKKRVEENQNIQYLKNRILEKVKFENAKLELGFLCTEKVETYSFNYLLLAIGRKPELSFLGKKINKQLELLIDDKKLFLVGDVKNKRYRQLSIAAGDGMRVAMEINDTLTRYR